MKITKTALKRIIKEELANLRESRDDERFKSYRGIMSDEVPSMGTDAEEEMSNQQRIEEVIDSIELVEEYIRKAVDEFTPGFNEGGPVYNALRHAKEELEALKGQI